jgi:predicted transcriptional regulator
MHDQPNAGPQAPAPGSRAYEVQCIVLLELVLAPPRHTDDVAELAARSGEPRADVEAALQALTEAGLAARDERVAWATPAARYCEALYRLCP